MKKIIILLLCMLGLALSACDVDPETLIKPTMENGDFCSEYKVQELYKWTENKRVYLVKCDKYRVIMWCNGWRGNDRYCKILYKCKSCTPKGNTCPTK